tara:strand:- start:795 stop:2135 length:1341 start_codon:yes stop_codon:yes gene_type:complete
MSRLCLFIAAALSAVSFASAEPPTASKQFENLPNLPDRTNELRKLISESQGSFVPASGIYRITDTLEFSLNRKRSVVIRASDGPVTIIMDGPGPAIRVIGSHEGSASPKSFEVATWNERMPLIDGIEIIGSHPEADGIELIQCVQPTITRVAIRWCRHAIRLSQRNRNVAIASVHLYENSGIGLFLDDVNLHQINVSNSHISYNRGGGIVVRDGNVRNLHITGCDIEANMPADDTPTMTANILLDVSNSTEESRCSIAEVAITGCTIQHSSNYTKDDYDSIAPGGANIRILGKESWPIDSVAITGNVISDTSVLIDISRATDITLTGNTFFAPNPDFLHAKFSKRIIVNGNTFNPRQFNRPGRLLFDDCQDCIISNCTFRRLEAEDGAIKIRNSTRFSLNSNNLSESTSGLRIENSEEISVKNWLVSGLPQNTPFLSKDKSSSVLE